MTQCWKCSAELSEAPRCGGCGTLNSIGDIHVHGIIRDDDEVTTYAVEDSPGHLIIDLHKKRGLLSQLPKPTKKGALESKAFKKSLGLARVCLVLNSPIDPTDHTAQDRELGVFWRRPQIIGLPVKNDGIVCLCLVL